MRQRILDKQIQETEKVNEAARNLIAVGRTCLDSIKEVREQHDLDFKKLSEAQAATDEKLNILIETVDKIIRRRNGGGE